jgi:hypothetical protein
MRREFEERMDKMKGEVQKIQEEKVHLMGLEQRLRQEFQTQVQAEQMSNEELRIRSLCSLNLYLSADGCSQNPYLSADAANEELRIQSLFLFLIYSCFFLAVSLRKTILQLTI